MKDFRKLSYGLGTCRVNPSDNTIVFTTATTQNLSPNTQSQHPQQSIDAGQTKISLQPKFIEVLSYLAHSYPNVVTRDELIDKVWEGNSYVGSKALTNAIWHLRQQLSPLNIDGAVIETVRKTGYRLLLAPSFETLKDPQANLLQTTQAKLQRITERMRYLIALVGVMLLGGGAWLGTHLHQDKQDKTDTTIIALTKEPGSERFPKLSGDGRWLVYGASRPGEVSSLYLKELKRDLPARQLTPTSSSELRAVWSRDNSKLYFASLNLTSHVCAITELTLATNGMRAIAPCSTELTAIALSPDGKYLSYISAHEQDKSGGIYRLSLHNKDAMVERQSCETGCNFEDRDLAYSPDGSKLAIARRFSNISEDIFIRDLTTSNEVRLTEGLEDVRGLSWTPDSRQLVYATEDSGSRNGFIIDIDTATIRTLGVEGMSYPSDVSNKGELVYHQYRRQFQMAYFGLEDSVPGSLFPLLYSSVSHRNPDYSPKAERLVFVASDTGYNEIWTSDSNGQKLEQQTKLKSRVAYPRWSPDGSKVAFLAPDDRNEGNRIFILDFTSKNITALASPYHNHGRPSWNWQGSAVFASTTDGISEFYLDNRAPRVISPLSMGVGYAQSDNQLVFTRFGMNGLWRLDLANPEKVELLIPSAQFRAGNNWVLTSDGVYFKSHNADEQQLNFWDFNRQQTRRLIRVPRSSLSGFGSMTYIPESKRLVMTLDGFPQRDIMLLKHKLIK
ncbi:winged helix-turn-helix domain-containing protein [Shewanella sp. A25]|nr:winged helix-turn-helix domain-containing protein [Shewanella shenzhenensis]